MFGGSFAPVGWAFCNGALLAIDQNDALFTLIGTTYGGDGENTFQLPDLQGRFPVHQGTSPGTGTTYQMGEKAGVESVTLTVNQLPAHGHVPRANANAGNSGTPSNSIWGKPSTPMYASAPSQNVSMAATSVGGTGGSQPHENMMPFLCITFIIALEGIFPQMN